MSSAVHDLPPSSRLWGALAGSPHRETPPKGLDLIGAWLHGRAFRRRTRTDRMPRALRIVERSDELQSYSDAGLQDRAMPIIDAARLRPDAAEAVDAAFALLREIVRRELGISLHPEQIMGALAMADGAAAEMATGEGKTVTAILPTALLAWQGRGVHVLTVNDYLAERDAQIVTGSLARVGLRVGFVTNDTPKPERRTAYDADVTYAADKQVVFDFLRDRLIAPLNPRLTACLLDDIVQDQNPSEFWHERIVQRGLFAAVIDEADSVLIDEAVTPAIISADPTDDGGNADDPSGHYMAAAALARELIEDEHYTLDRQSRHVELLPAGIARTDAVAAQLPEFWAGRRRREELIRTAVMAKDLMHRGDDYIIRKGKVEIIDRSTGRVLEGRRWQLGMQQAVEAKEGVATSDARRTSSRISYARFFQGYRTLCGMSGTLSEVQDELWRTYGLPVLKIPTHRPIARIERADTVHRNAEQKFRAVAVRVQTLHAKGQPVLVGTRSVIASESVAAEIEALGIACRVLNAEREQEEAEIVAEAGRVGAVTVATNMAGRGTDIKLDDAARSLGGLAVIGTERHRERRVDRQLFGRSGRQGDPGSAEMHVSFDDDLIEAVGLPTLVRLAARVPMLAPLLWKQAQLTGSSRARSMRSSATSHDSWLELSIHTRSR